MTMAFATCGQVLLAALKVSAVMGLALGNEVWSMMKGSLPGGKKGWGTHWAPMLPLSCLRTRQSLCLDGVPSAGSPV